MKELQLKGQKEASEATKQLEDARKRAAEAAINAADAIAKVAMPMLYYRQKTFIYKSFWQK